MKKGLTEIVFILDRSGSMSGLETDTIGGYNSMLEKQKAEEGEALLSTVLFDDRVEILHDRKSLSQVKPITEKEYFVRGSTALLDAVGGAIRHIGNVHKYAISGSCRNPCRRKSVRKRRSSSSLQTGWRTPAVSTPTTR